MLCFLSSDMTKETKVLEATTIMNLTNTPEEWAINILDKAKSYKRINTKEEISSNNFNIEVEASKLEKKYIRLMK